MLRLAYLTVAAVLATGCTLHFGGDDGGDDACDYPAGGGGLEAPALEVLNPETLTCEAWWGGGGGCDPACGPCATDEDARPAPTWAYCYSGCEALAESQCLATTACRAAYDYGCYTGGTCDAITDFIGCYGTDQTGPIQGACDNLDAQTCSMHDDCIALHTPQCSGDPATCWQQFVECRDELTCYTPVYCDVAPPRCPDDSTPAIKNGCYTGACLPLSQCEPLDCPGTDCG